MIRRLCVCVTVGVCDSSQFRCIARGFIHEQVIQSYPLTCRRVCRVGEHPLRTVRNGLQAGLDQMGGYVAAYDVDSGDHLWTLKVCDNQRKPEK